ncbi:MAG: hypothetical protein AAGI38_04775 [Bacteroidota bacterium]
MEFAIMILGFMLASYSVVGNDVIQTLGTFLTSNEDRPWWVLWLFAGGIMTVILVIGYMGWGEWLGGNDVAYDRLDKLVYQVDPATKDFVLDANGNRIEEEFSLSLWYLLPPVILLFITRLGIPVSTTFLILSFFSFKNLPDMLFKSLLGYALAFGVGYFFYLAASKPLEKIFLKRPMNSDDSIWTNKSFWIAAQWVSTGFLWSQWLTQDLANIYIYFGNPERLSPGIFFLTVAVLVGMLAYIFYQRGGAIQGIVKAKTNTADIRSATFIDLFYGMILMFFKYDVLGVIPEKIPMSTTWVFLGLLAGRELAIRSQLGPKPDRSLSLMIFADLGKAALGLIVSVVLVLVLYWAEGRDMASLFLN